jgi:hypothetical protein
MKDEFISTVSHELRTPLTSLRASLGLISSGSLDKRPEKQKQMLEVAIGNCDRLVRLVNDILDFDRVERGGMPLNREVLPVGDILRRAADVEHDAALKAQITFRFDTPAGLLVNVDQERILQVLSELVSNAIKFSPPQTIIKLSAQAAGRSRNGPGRGQRGRRRSGTRNSAGEAGYDLRAIPAGRCFGFAGAGWNRPGPRDLPEVSCSSMADASGPKVSRVRAAGSCLRCLRVRSIISTWEASHAIRNWSYARVTRSSSMAITRLKHLHSASKGTDSAATASLLHA